MSSSAWPPLPLAEWQETYASLLLRTQMVGKTRLALSPMENHWWQVALYVSARGLTTSPMPAGARTLEVEFDFLTHRLVARTSDGASGELPLRPQPTAAFTSDYVALLRSLDVEVRIRPVPVEAAASLPFSADGHAAYDPDAALRWWRILVQVDQVLRAFRGRFLGKCSPSHFWWGAFDLACTRFSGARAPRHPGGLPNLPDWITREAYSHACSSAGWWPGSPGVLDEPAFYSYAYPEPPGFKAAAVKPAGALYHSQFGEWILPYEVVRTAADPEAVLLEFLETTYAAAATLGGWPRAALERPAPFDPHHPPPAEESATNPVGDRP